MLLVTDDQGRWHPGIGDPTLMGWLTVVAYFVTAWLCARAARAAHASAFVQRARLAAYWIGLTVLLTFLGFNKQLDLQSLFTQTARDLSLARGWYEERRTYQLVFIVGVGLASVFTTVVAFVWLRRHLRRLGGGLLGLGLLLGFVAVRAASFHHVDQLLSVELVGLRFNWIMELGAIALIARSALRSGGPPPWQGRIPNAHKSAHKSAHKDRGSVGRSASGREEIPIEVRVRPASRDADPPT